MIWLFFGVLGALSVVGVSAWARASHRKVEADRLAQREAARLKTEEAQLLARLRAEKGEGEG